MVLLFTFSVTKISYFGKRPNDGINGKSLLTYKPGITVHVHKDPTIKMSFYLSGFQFLFVYNLSRLPRDFGGSNLYVSNLVSG